MQNLTILTLSTLILAGAARADEPPACTLPASAKTVDRVAQLPAEVRDALLSNGPVSDPNGPFNASDVIIDATQIEPRQRLVSGQAGADVICLRVEQGGRGYHHALMRFQRQGEHWTQVSQTNVLPESTR